MSDVCTITTPNDNTRIACEWQNHATLIIWRPNRASTKTSKNDDRQSVIAFAPAMSKRWNVCRIAGNCPMIDCSLVCACVRKCKSRGGPGEWRAVTRATIDLSRIITRQKIANDLPSTTDSSGLDVLLLTSWKRGTVIIENLAHHILKRSHAHKILTNK